MELKETLQLQKFRKLYLSQLNRLNEGNHKIIISFFGIISDDFIHELIETLERYLIERKVESNRVKIIYSISLQSLNNMYVYGGYDDEEQKLISFFVSKRNERIHVFTANLISNQQETFLIDYLNKINFLTPVELSNMYHDAIKKSFKSKDQNGIGLIFMRYFSDEPLKFRFDEASNQKIFSIEMS